jgi:pimeloyl-ACP methyl ester carboxylesterase
MRDFINRSEQKYALIRRTDKENTKLVIFVHGFIGNYLDTWGKLPELLKTDSDSDDTFRDWDYLFQGYSTFAIDSYLDIARLIKTQWESAANGTFPFKSKYQTLALMGHSLGTLGIRQLLCNWSEHPPGILQAIKGVCYFGSPINGSSLAKAGALFTGIGSALIPSNPQLRMLHRWTACCFGKDDLKWPNPRVVVGIEDMVVGKKFPEFSNWEGDGKPSFFNMGHSQLSKPKDLVHSEVGAIIKETLK